MQGGRLGKQRVCACMISKGGCQEQGEGVDDITDNGKEGQEVGTRTKGERGRERRRKTGREGNEEGGREEANQRVVGRGQGATAHLTSAIALVHPCTLHHHPHRPPPILSPGWGWLSRACCPMDRSPS